MLLVDPEDPFPPLPCNKWILPLNKHKDDIDTLLWRIPELVSGGKGKEIINDWENSGRYLPSYACPTAALKAVQLALSEVGGRVTLLTSSAPDIGFGKIKRQLKTTLYGTEHEFPYYSALEIAAELNKNQEEKDTLLNYVSLSNLLAENGTCVDIFILNSTSTTRRDSTKSAPVHSSGRQSQVPPEIGVENSALFAEICRRSGGSLHSFVGSLHIEDNIFRLQSVKA
jgi:hypothetical protein